MRLSNSCRTRGSLVLASSSSRGLSFTRSGVPVPAEERPSRIFRNMFVDGTAAEINAQVQRLKQGQSVMDTVLGEAKDFQRGLGRQDLDKLEKLSDPGCRMCLADKMSASREARAGCVQRQLPGHELWPLAA